MTKHEPEEVPWTHIFPLFFDFRTKWKRQTAVGLELLAEAGNFAAVQRLYAGQLPGAPALWPGGGFPPPPGAGHPPGLFAPGAHHQHLLPPHHPMASLFGGGGGPNGGPPHHPGHPHHHPFAPNPMEILFRQSSGTTSSPSPPVPSLAKPMPFRAPPANNGTAPGAPHMTHPFGLSPFLPPDHPGFPPHMLAMDPRFSGMHGFLAAAAAAAAAASSGANQNSGNKSISPPPQAPLLVASFGQRSCTKSPSSTSSCPSPSPLALTSGDRASSVPQQPSEPSGDERKQRTNA